MKNVITAVWLSAVMMIILYAKKRNHHIWEKQYRTMIGVTAGDTDKVGQRDR